MYGRLELPIVCRPSFTARKDLAVAASSHRLLSRQSGSDCFQCGYHESSYICPLRIDSFLRYSSCFSLTLSATASAALLCIS